MCERYFFKIPFFVFLFSCLIAHASFAQTPPAPAASACDPLYYDTLESRAWLEAQREITQNQNLILKPDSVLQYTCFDSHIGSMKNAATTMFTQGSNLNDVAQVAADYVEANFTDVHPSELGERSTESSFLVASPTAAAYSCNEMAKIWRDARCMNFVDEPSSDAFFTFEEYVSAPDDLRFPAGYCTPKTGQWTTELDAQVQSFTSPPSPTGTQWVADDVVTFLEEIDPEHPSSAGCSSSQYFKTGVTVYSTQAPNTYQEQTCLMLGCVYEPTGLVSGSCTTP